MSGALLADFLAEARDLIQQAAEDLLALERDPDAKPAHVMRFGRQVDMAGIIAYLRNMNAFDAATVGFGARNFSDLRQGLAEMARVVRPGGRVVVLEMGRYRNEADFNQYELWAYENMYWRGGPNATAGSPSDTSPAS